MATKTVAAAPACPNCGHRHRRITPEMCADRSMTEKTLQNRVIAHAKKRGWKVVHVGRGFVGGEDGQFVTQTAPGWPDLVMFNPKMPHPVIAMELKRQQGEVADLQMEWLRLFNECNIPAIIVRPFHLRVGIVDSILSGR